MPVYQACKQHWAWFSPVIIQRTHVDTANRHKIDDQKVKIDG
jgi:hypothetical protein